MRRRTYAKVGGQELDAGAGAHGLEGEEEVAREQVGGRVGPAHRARVLVGLHLHQAHLPVLARASAAPVLERARYASFLLQRQHDATGGDEAVSDTDTDFGYGQRS
jgi:hypothetical protein